MLQLHPCSHFAWNLVGLNLAFALMQPGPVVSSRAQLAPLDLRETYVHLCVSKCRPGGQGAGRAASAVPATAGAAAAKQRLLS
jgi:hypothetical protein